MVPSLTFTQVCQGLIHYKTAVGLSPHTINEYKVAFARLALFLGEDPASTAAATD